MHGLQVLKLTARAELYGGFIRLQMYIENVNKECS